MKRLWTILAALSLPYLAWSQEGASLDALAELDDQQPELRRYTVEVIIFAYAEDVHVGTEVFEPEMVELAARYGEPVADDSVRIFSDTQTNPARTTPDMQNPDEPGIDAPRINEQFQFVVLSKDEFTLIDTLRHLRRLDVYQPLMHFGWTQTTLPEDGTPELDLNRLGRVPEGLEGNLKLYLNRYLHLVVDLSLQAPGTAASVEYEIHEDRILKNGETRYYDHPKFGVIAKVQRVEDEPTEQTPNPASGAAAGVN